MLKQKNMRLVAPVIKQIKQTSILSLQQESRSIRSSKNILWPKLKSIYIAFCTDSHFLDAHFIMLMIERSVILFMKSPEQKRQC